MCSLVLTTSVVKWKRKFGEISGGLMITLYSDRELQMGAVMAFLMSYMLQLCGALICVMIHQVQIRLFT